MQLKNKHWGSTLGIVAGSLLILSELGNLIQNNETIGSFGLITGLIVILASISYKNRKKGKFQNKEKISVLEIITALGLIYHIFFGISSENFYDNPINFLAVPIWIIVAYVILITGKVKIDEDKKFKTSDTHRS